MSYRGLGATSQLYDCPSSTSKDMPSGLSAKFKASYPLSNPSFTRLMCASDSPIADECNQSAMPGVCFYAKTAQPRTDGGIPSYMGRPSEQSDWQKWRAWRPGLSFSSGTKVTSYLPTPSSEAAPPVATPTGPVEEKNEWIVPAVVVGGLIVAGAIFYFARKN